jgi:hypothetical protein
MMPSRLGAIGWICVICAFGCGGSSHSGDPNAALAAADGGAADAGIGQNVNPEGVPYPDPPTGYGRTARIGRQPGGIIKNFKFLGYRNGDRTAGLTTIALADYYDPCQKRYKLLHLTVSAVWCPNCVTETDIIVANKKKIDAEGVAVIQALDDGPVMNVDATVMDLNGWMFVHRSNFTEMLDPGLHNLGGFFDAAAVPWHVDIDVRTMEMLGNGFGVDPAFDLSVPLQQGSVDMPAYPVPISCP